MITEKIIEQAYKQIRLQEDLKMLDALTQYDGFDGIKELYIHILKNKSEVLSCSLNINGSYCVEIAYKFEMPPNKNCDIYTW